MSGIETQNAENEDLEIGGFPRLNPEAIVKQFEWEVTGYETIETEWGKRVDFSGLDSAGFGVCISSWNMVSSIKLKPKEMIGKKFLIKPYDKKKVFLVPI